MIKILRTAPTPIVLLVASFLAPTELSLYVAGLRLPPHRIALICLLVPAALRLLTRRDIRVRAFDVMFVLYAMWTFIVFALHGTQTDSYGVETVGVVYGGSVALESLGGYLVARAWVRDQQTFRATLVVLFWAVAAAGLVALPEMILGHHFVHDMLQNLTGYVHPRTIETRLGLTRAYGTFDHPIHLGTFCASLVALIWAAERRLPQRAMRISIIMLATFASLSSAPILCLLVQFGLLTWEWLTRRIANRLAISLLLVAGLFAGAAMVSSRSPFALIATGLTLDRSTGFYRLLIWEHGMHTVMAHAWLGIGLADWPRPWWMAAATVDAFWLVTAMRNGVPALLLLLVAMVLLVRSAVAKGGRSDDVGVRRLMRAWAISLTALSLAACTVHFWNVTYAYYFFFLGLGGWIADPKRVRARRATRMHHPSLRVATEQRMQPA